MSELTDNGALALAGLIRRREVSVRDVVKAHLERIDAVNGRIHAVVRCSETALDEADRADRALADGAEPGVLHGVPFTVKDWIETQGLVCDGGFPERNGHVPTADATVVARLRRAGGVVLGKTRAGSDPRLHPPALNPHDPTRTAGSSSGGEAALVADFGSPLGLGSDSGGSLRWPAHCCGVAALKPSAGLVPLTGHYPPIVTLTDPRTVIGPMARCVADLAVALSLIAGPDGVDPSTVPARVDDHMTLDLATLRVAWFTDFDGVAACPATRSVIERVIGVLDGLGASVRQAAPPRIDEAMAITRAYWARPESLSLDDWKPWGRSTLSADEVEESLFRWERLRRALLGFMADVDVIVCPVAAEVAPARHEPRADDYAFTVPFSLTGSPVVVIPAGRGEGDLPIGIQIVGAPYRDQLALSVAGTLERSLSR